MILLDYNQIMIANMFAYLSQTGENVVDEGMMRHMCLNKIQSVNKIFRKEFGELIVCADQGSSWRKRIFPYYKASRKSGRDDSFVDWDEIFSHLDQVKKELNEDLPYKVISIPNVEADDIIGTICHEEGTYLSDGKPILIMSSDKDFIQLHSYGNVKQYNPIKKEYVTHGDPEQYLIEHIFKGDGGDGIPNVRSADDVFVNKIRQKPITKKILEERFEHKDMQDDQIKKNFERNTNLIDLSKIPQDIKNEIIMKYEEPNEKTKSGMLNYLIEHKLKNLTQHLNNF